MSFLNDLENEVRAGFQPTEEQVKEGVRGKIDVKITEMEGAIEDRQAELNGLRQELEAARLEREVYMAPVAVDQPQG